MSAQKPILKAASWAAGILPAPLKKVLYQWPFLARLIRRSLNAAASEGFSTTTIAGGPARGLRMVLDLQSEKDYWLGTYEVDLQGTAAKLITPGSVVYDIGANIGYISLVSAQLSGINGKIFSFEALPANVERLTENVQLNGLEKRVSIIHAAVIDADHPVAFLTHSSGAMGKAVGSAGRDEAYSGQITVPGIAIDTFIYVQNHPEPDLVKIDIEGGEGSALDGMQQLLSKKQPIFLIELHGEQAARLVWERLLAHDYKIFKMAQAHAPIKHVDDLDWKAYIIAVPEHMRSALT